MTFRKNITIYIQCIHKLQKKLQLYIAKAQREEAQAARDVAQAQAQREHELEVLRLRGNRHQDQQNERNNTKTPKLPSFVEGKNEIDNFIRRFERYALANGWAEIGQSHWEHC